MSEQLQPGRSWRRRESMSTAWSRVVARGEFVVAGVVLLAALVVGIALTVT